MGKRVLVTGAGGFVGSHLCSELVRQCLTVRGTTRRASGVFVAGVEIAVVPNFADYDSLARALDGVDWVVHLAARVHVMNESAVDPLSEFRRANVDGTAMLCEAARRAGASRFIHLSSAKVYGDGADTPYSEATRPDPQDDYSRSKLESELVVSDTLGTALPWTILRPPLIYGPRVGGNFKRLLRIATIAARLRLPLGGICNRRSLLYVGNLVDAIVCCLESPGAVNRRLLVSDGEDISTSGLIEQLSLALGGTGHLAPCPVGLVRSVLRVIGRGSEDARLFGSYSIDSSVSRRQIGWVPPFSLSYGLSQTALWWKSLAADEDVLTAANKP